MAPAFTHVKIDETQFLHATLEHILDQVHQSAEAGEPKDRDWILAQLQAVSSCFRLGEIESAVPKIGDQYSCLRDYRPDFEVDRTYRVVGVLKDHLQTNSIGPAVWLLDPESGERKVTSLALLRWAFVWEQPS